MNPAAALRAMRPVKSYTCAHCGRGFTAPARGLEENEMNKECFSLFVGYRADMTDLSFLESFLTFTQAMEAYDHAAERYAEVALYDANLDRIDVASW